MYLYLMEFFDEKMAPFIPVHRESARYFAEQPHRHICCERLPETFFYEPYILLDTEHRRCPTVLSKALCIVKDTELLELPYVNPSHSSEEPE